MGMACNVQKMLSCRPLKFYVQGSHLTSRSGAAIYICAYRQVACVLTDIVQLTASGLPTCCASHSHCTVSISVGVAAACLWRFLPSHTGAPTCSRSFPGRSDRGHKACKPKGEKG